MAASAPGDRTPITIKTGWGDELTVVAEDLSHYGDVLDSGISRAYETQYLDPHVEPGDVVVDVGANYGYTTTYFASEVGPSGFVIDYCDEVTERFREAGRTQLHGILYVHAAPPEGVR